MSTLPKEKKKSTHKLSKLFFSPQECHFLTEPDHYLGDIIAIEYLVLKFLKNLVTFLNFL